MTMTEEYNEGLRTRAARYAAAEAQLACAHEEKKNAEQAEEHARRALKESKSELKKYVGHNQPFKAVRLDKTVVIIEWYNEASEPGVRVEPLI